MRWYGMWAQGFPENDKSPEGLTLVHTFREMMAACRRGNMIGIAAMVYLIAWPPWPNRAEKRNMLAPFFLIGNAFALWFSLYYIPRAEQRHGILYAHRIFVRINVITALFTICVGAPIAIHKEGSYYIEGVNGEYELGSGSPLFCVILSALVTMLVGTLHLAMFPLKYRAIVQVGLTATVITAPRYSQLGHAQEVLILLLSLALGEVVGITVQRMMMRSFAATRAAQADHQRLTSRLEAIDAEKERLTSRLEQIDAEKERLTYELLLEQQKGAAASKAASRPRASRAGSNYGSDSELGSLLSANRHVLGRDERRSRREAAAARRSPARSSTVSEACSCEVGLSASMRQRLNASLSWMGGDDDQ